MVSCPKSGSPSVSAMFPHCGSRRDSSIESPPSPGSSALAPLREKGLKLLQQQGQVSLNRFPDDLEIDIAVIVNDAIAHADHLPERNVGELGARLGRESRSGLPGDEKAPKDGILR